MKIVMAGLASLVLVSCGADGAPMRPTASGNVTIGTNGVSTSTVIGVTNGTVSAGVGF